MLSLLFVYDGLSGLEGNDPLVCFWHILPSLLMIDPIDLEGSVGGCEM
jgi:hypothetical protein